MMNTVTMTETQKIMNKILTDIARKNFGNIETLETRGMDDLDFHEVSVWSLRQALEDAFISGMTTQSLEKGKHF